MNRSQPEMEKRIEKSFVVHQRKNLIFFTGHIKRRHNQEKTFQRIPKTTPE